MDPSGMGLGFGVGNRCHPQSFPHPLLPPQLPSKVAQAEGVSCVCVPPPGTSCPSAAASSKRCQAAPSAGDRRQRQGTAGGDRGANSRERGAASAWGERGHEGDRGSCSLLSPLGPQPWLSRGRSRQAQPCGDTERRAATRTPVWSSASPGGAGDVPKAPLSRLWSPPAVCHPLGRGDPWARGRTRAHCKRGAGSRARGWRRGGCTAPRAHTGQTLAVPRPHPAPGKGSSP